MAQTLEERRKYHREYMRRWTAANREKKRESDRRSRLRHLEESRRRKREHQRRWRAENPQAAKDRANRWYAKHKEKVAERVRERRRAAPPEVREKEREYARRHREANRQKYAEYQLRRTARRRENGWELYDRRDIYERDDGVCHLCNEPVPWSKMSIDHVIPLSKGGPDTPENVRTAHQSCNFRRGARMLSGR